MEEPDENCLFVHGENCLADHLINRYGLKSFTTPYSWGRSNVEVLLQIEKDHFKEFLNPEKMKVEQQWNQDVLRLKTYNHLQNRYHSSCMNGFEFVHHVVLNQLSVREKIASRCRKMMDLNADKAVLFYHHRAFEHTDERLLMKHLRELRKLYLKRCRQVEVICFTQVIVKDESERKMTYRFVNGIHVYQFYTMKVWEGKDPEILWAKCDDDLIQMMFEQIRKDRWSCHLWSEFRFYLSEKKKERR